MVGRSAADHAPDVHRSRHNEARPLLLSNVDHSTLPHVHIQSPKGYNTRSCISPPGMLEHNCAPCVRAKLSSALMMCSDDVNSLLRSRV